MLCVNLWDTCPFLNGDRRRVDCEGIDGKGVGKGVKEGEGKYVGM